MAEDGVLATHAPGDLIFEGTDPGALSPLLLVSGLARTRLTQASGRMVTVRYARPGAIIGLVPFFIRMDPSRPRLTNWATSWRQVGGESRDVEVLQKTVVLHLNVNRVRAAMTTHPDLVMLCARNIAEQLVATQQRLADELFQPVRSRLATHLLTLADRSGAVIVVRVSHEAIAGALGSVREVVSRQLKQLEREGILRRSDGAGRYIEIVKPEVLRQIALGEEPLLGEGR
ncbi:hypothetical protein DC31_04335 [Microbacterium sp. CH12i]|uniref:Crp/Fnr family transcriptional regulator n=1 Tax=Microbacterium sp. CH12i TaxID=1479651 RepID=UPI000461A094|nr:Crp/Fnr family transcriptional regulator [Microbacterium sp. CH12i]KDA04873.1 hypothetical protein DC31_04335 [Microbacterium sp. CH12i]